MLKLWKIRQRICKICIQKRIYEKYNRDIYEHVPQIPGGLYLWFALPIFFLTFSFNTWAVLVIMKKEQNGMNQMIIKDCVVKIFCNALIFLIYGSPFSIHGSHFLARILCWIRSVLTSLLFGIAGKNIFFLEPGFLGQISNYSGDWNLVCFAKTRWCLFLLSSKFSFGPI